jgi:hypothetical protein
MEREFRYVSPDDLAEWWRFVRAGLEHTLQKMGGDKWMPEDIYLGIKTGQCTLHVSLMAHRPVGFVVLRPVQDYDGKALHIWVAYSAERGATDAHMPELKEFAHAMRAKRLTFESRRKGWNRFALKHGYQVAHTAYELPLTTTH